MQIFGIRHHGPGSAQQLKIALENYQPDILLVEGPPDGEALLKSVAHPEMQPPVAMLVYNPSNLSQASFFPFAEFSPEWQAILHGLKEKIAVRFMDLPMERQFLLKEERAQELHFFDKTVEENELLRLDPFSRLAKLAGFSDPERWWEATIERQNQNPEAIFQSILELMTALREDKFAAGQFETRETLLREAWMRQTIRQAKNEGFQKIAVICGAWHSPALAGIDKIKTTADVAILKGLKKVKTVAVWAPWSFDRLSISSGYAAGVLAPMWYRLLFADRENATTNWFVGAAQVLRKKDFAVSPGHVIEAIRLADALAKIRFTEFPGIEELRESAKTVLCEGSEKPLELIDSQMVIGEILGQVPPSKDIAPLKSDLEKEAKSARLEISSREQKLELDLRKPTDLLKSKLLHRVNLLKIFWGKELSVQGQKQGSFHENWTVKWLPDFEIQLIEMSVWGNSILDAASRFSIHKIRETEDLPDLTGLISSVLKADLPEILPDLMRKLQSVAAVSKDVLSLADAVLPLASALRYGSARKIKLDILEKLIAQIVPRVCVQLPSACCGVDEDLAETILKTVVNFNRALAMLSSFGDALEPNGFDENWRGCLVQICENQLVAPLPAGLAARFLFDKNFSDAEKTGNLIQFRLSHLAEPLDGARWLEGFLHGSGLLLIHHPGLWQILDAWLSELDFEIFREILPLLRRTFSKFEPAERQKMLDLAKNQLGLTARKTVDFQINEAQAAEVLPFLKLIFS